MNSFDSASNFVVISADFSPCTNDWEVLEGLSGLRWTLPTAYHPERTFVILDALASEMKPFWIKLEYITTMYDSRSLRGYVYPTAAGVWETHKICIADLQTTYNTGTPPGYVTAMEIGIGYHIAQPEISWQHGTNFLYVDNVSYYVEPPALNLSVAGTNLDLCWPTNAPEYKLEESVDCLSGCWVEVSVAPTIVNQMFKTSIPISQNSHFYRLKASF
jgi:hypothetical protein